MKRIVLGLIISSVCQLAAADLNPESIVGTWCSQDKTKSISFKMHLSADGKYEGATYMTKTGKLNPSSQGIYKISGNNIIVGFQTSSFDLPGIFDTLPVKVKENGTIEVSRVPMSKCD